MLLREPENGYALVHYGFCLKVGDKNLEEGYKFLKAGIDSGYIWLNKYKKCYLIIAQILNIIIKFIYLKIHLGEPGTQDARFFFHMGDAMQRLGLSKQVTKKE